MQVKKFFRSFAISVLSVVVAMLIVGCPVTLSVNPSPQVPCPVWTQYNPDSKCDISMSSTLLSTSTLEVTDIAEYAMVRMVVVNFDVLVLKSAHIRIETDRGEEVVIESSRLLPGAYVVYNQTYNPEVNNSESQASFSLICPQGSSDASAYLSFEFIRPASPTPVPTPESTE